MREARDALGLSTAELAKELLLDEANVTNWEAGRVRAPKRIERDLIWRAAVARRDEALKHSGLPECAWTTAWEAKLEDPAGQARLQEYIQELNAHSASCDVCSARVQWCSEHLPPLPPPPLSPVENLLGHFANAVTKLPPWARPAAWGALIVGAMTLFRGIITMLGQGFSWMMIGGMLAAIVVAGYAGAVGGVAYYFAKPRVERFGRYAEYVLGIVCVIAYLLAFGIPLALISRPGLAELTVMAVIALPVSALFGVILGRQFIPRERRSSNLRFGIILGSVVAVSFGALLLWAFHVDTKRNRAARIPTTVAEAQATVTESPNDVHALWQLGRILLDSVRYTEAIAPLKTAASIAPLNDTVNWALAHAYQNTGDYQRAADYSRRAVQQLPSWPGYHWELGLALIGLKDYAGALQSFRTIVTLDSTDAQAWLNRARLAYTQQLWQECLAAYARVDELNRSALNDFENDKGTRQQCITRASQ